MRLACALVAGAAHAAGGGGAARARRQLDEEPPPPPPVPLPPYPSVSYVVNVTRLNDAKPIISSAIGNSSSFAYNFHPTWVSPSAAPDGRRHQRYRRLDEEPPAPPPADGLLLQVQPQPGGANGSAATPRLALVQRTFPQNASAPGTRGAAPPAPVLGGDITFEAIDPSKIVLTANGAEENFGVGNPSLVYSAADEQYHLLYAGESLNNRTQRLHRSLHYATSTEPSKPESWVWHGPVFSSYPLNATETEYATLLLNTTWGSGAPPGTPHYLIFSSSADAPGAAAGLQIARSASLGADASFEVLPNTTLLDPRTGLFDSNGLTPGPAAEPLADGTLLYFYNGLKYAVHNNASQPPWQVSAGYAVLDASRPLTVLQRGDKPILEPEEAWELKGRVANSVLLSGLRRVDPPKADLPYWADQFVGYYSGAESAVGAALLKVHCVSTNPSLESLFVTAGGSGRLVRRRLEEGDPLDPPFAPNIFEYDLSEGEFVPYVTVVASSLSPFANMTVQNKEVERGVPVNVTIGTGQTKTVTVHVVAEDGHTALTYVVHVNRASSSYCELSGLKISTGTLSPPFSTNVTEYTVSYPNNVANVKVTPTTAKTADIKVNGKEVKSGEESEALALASGAATTITVAVTSQDGKTTLAYRIVAARGPSPVRFNSILIRF